ncbi:hypothetical protein [[Clostridium] colinum]|uniref:hypothetical protein n=1 Tax=[Clostridium] colinum TaxID=36835 RepID=UPI00202527E8|nr:hypothetical protein [[Clostridium] colinum]
MKKSKLALISLEILLIIVTVGYNVFGIGQPKNIENVIQRELKKDEMASLNYILKYKMPSNYEEVTDLYGEIAIREKENNCIFTSEIVPTDTLSPEDFFKSQEDIFTSASNFSVINEDTIDLEDRTINKKVYKISNDFMELYALVGTIEIKSNPNEFIGVVGNATSADFESDLDLLLNSIKYTKQTLNSERFFSDDIEKVSVVVPANWKKFKKDVPYSFFKEDENGIAYSVLNSGSKKDEDPKEGYDYIKNVFTEDENAVIIEDSKVETVDNKTITTTIVEYPENKVTTILTLVEFNNSDVFVAVRQEVVSENGIDYIKPELDAMVKSLKLKLN